MLLLQLRAKAPLFAAGGATCAECNYALAAAFSVTLLVLQSTALW